MARPLMVQVESTAICSFGEPGWGSEVVEFTWKKFEEARMEKTIVGIAMLP